MIKRNILLQNYMEDKEQDRELTRQQQDNS
jgi:hypothetical protein